VLLSKTLQQLANGTEFKHKEGYARTHIGALIATSPFQMMETCNGTSSNTSFHRYMTPLNPFLHQSRATMTFILKTIAVLHPLPLGGCYRS
jgi:hypothetical protein